MELGNLTLEELKTLSSEVSEKMSAMKTEMVADAKLEAQENADKFREDLAVGDTVSFLFGRDNDLCEGTVIRISDKTVTVESDSFEKGHNYVKYHRFVDILESADVDVDDESDVEDDNLDMAM